MISSPACATAYARMFNISDVANLVNIANTIEAIQVACTGVTTEVRGPLCGSPSSLRVTRVGSRCCHPWVARNYA